MAASLKHCNKKFVNVPILKLSKVSTVCELPSPFAETLEPLSVELPLLVTTLDSTVVLEIPSLAT